MKRFDEALIAYEKALALDPALASGWLGRGNVSYELKRFDEALIAYEKAFALEPASGGVEGLRLMAKKSVCDWQNYDLECANLISSLRKGTVVWPFQLLAISLSSADNLQCASSYIRDQPTFPPIWHGEIYSHDRIRVAYLSADFHRHAGLHPVWLTPA